MRSRPRAILVLALVTCSACRGERSTSPRDALGNGDPQVIWIWAYDEYKPSLSLIAEIWARPGDELTFKFDVSPLVKCQVVFDDLGPRQPRPMNIGFAAGSRTEHRRVSPAARFLISYDVSCSWAQGSRAGQQYDKPRLGWIWVRS